MCHYFQVIGGSDVVALGMLLALQDVGVVHGGRERVFVCRLACRAGLSRRSLGGRRRKSRGSYGLPAFVSLRRGTSLARVPFFGTRRRLVEARGVEPLS